MKIRQNNFIKNGAAAESSVWRMLFPSFLGIIVCTICLAGMTWAWFTSGVQSQSTISAEEYSLQETVKVKDGAAIDKSADGTYTLAANTNYVVTVNPEVVPKNGGYCMLKIKSDGAETVYYTKALAASGFSFTISNGGKTVTCQVIAAWGEPDASKTTDKKLQDSGDVVKINGGAPDMKSTSTDETTNSKPVTVTKEDKGDSTGSDSVKSTSEQDGTNSQNQTDKASGSDKTDNKTN